MLAMMMKIMMNISSAWYRLEVIGSYDEDEDNDDDDDHDHDEDELGMRWVGGNRIQGGAPVPAHWIQYKPPRKVPCRWKLNTI